MSKIQPEFLGLYLFVKDLPETIRFYGRLGFEVEEVSDMFARVSWDNGIVLEFGTSELTKSYDKNWKAPGLPSTNTINLQLVSRASVDETWERMVAEGFTSHLPPCDPLWQARFAILLDPDGNYIGLHSPRDMDADRQREGSAR